MSDFKSIKDIFDRKNWDKGGFSKHEFQVYGYYLSEQLHDIGHKSLYIKLAKNEPRSLLEETLTFVKAARAKHPGKLFMWKLRKMHEESSKSKK